MIRPALLILMLFAGACGPLPSARCTPLAARCDDERAVVQLCASDQTWFDVTQCDGLCGMVAGKPECE